MGPHYGQRWGQENGTWKSSKLPTAVVVAWEWRVSDSLLRAHMDSSADGCQVHNVGVEQICTPKVTLIILMIIMNKVILAKQMHIQLRALQQGATLLIYPC